MKPPRSCYCSHKVSAVGGRERQLSLLSAKHRNIRFITLRVLVVTLGSWLLSAKDNNLLVPIVE